MQLICYSTCKVNLLSLAFIEIPQRPQDNGLVIIRLCTQADAFSRWCRLTLKGKIEEASSHKSAMTHAGNLDLWPFDPKINGFPELMVEHFRVMFGDHSCIDFWDIAWKTDRQTNKHTNAAENPTHATTVDVGNENTILEFGAHNTFHYCILCTEFMAKNKFDKHACTPARKGTNIGGLQQALCKL